jgi:hypothetical protein
MDNHKAVERLVGLYWPNRSLQQAFIVGNTY